MAEDEKSSDDEDSKDQERDEDVDVDRGTNEPVADESNTSSTVLEWVQEIEKKCVSKLAECSDKKHVEITDSSDDKHPQNNKSDKSYKPSSILERYLVESVQALEIDEENVPKLAECSDENSVGITDSGDNKVLQNDLSDDVGSIPEIPASVHRKSKASSLRSVSTIPPEEVKQRVKKEHLKQRKKVMKKRMTVKGEASAVNRSRRENVDNIKQSSNFDDWEM